MNRIEKQLSDLDTSKVDFKEGHWDCGRGGRPLEDHEWWISHYSEDFIESRYKLPQCLNEMLADQYKFGAEEAKAKIRDALGIRR
jgi:hypothetical protein